MENKLIDNKIIEKQLKNIFKHEILNYFIKWSILSIIIGIISGFLGYIFGFCIQEVTKVWHIYPEIKLIIPFAAIFIVFIYRCFKIYKPKGTNLVIESISTGEKVSPIIVPLIFISSNLSHLVGASVGREGAALQLGAGMGTIFAKLFKFKEKDRKLIMMCSMAACFAGLFGTPITASIFCIELFSVGTFYMSALMPCIFASFVGAGVASYFGFYGEIFKVTQTMPWNIKTFFLIIILAAISAIVAIVFCKCIHEIARFYAKYVENQYLKVLLGALLFLIFCLILRTDIYNGAGINLIKLAMKGELSNYDFFIKLILTSLAICAGFKGGEIIPSLAIGAALGVTISRILGIPMEVSVSLSIVSFFVGVTNCPLTSIFLAIELFRINDIYIYVLAVVTSFLLSGYYSIYSSQKFSYKKTGLEFLGKTAHSMVEKIDNEE